MAELESLTLDIQVDTSRWRASMGAIRKASWRLARQRRTLRWRRLEDGTVEVQRRPAPWSLPPFLTPMMRAAVQAAIDVEREAVRARLVPALPAGAPGRGFLRRRPA